MFATSSRTAPLSDISPLDVSLNLAGAGRSRIGGTASALPDLVCFISPQTTYHVCAYHVFARFALKIYRPDFI